MQRVTILEHDGGEMGNQLWGYISIYAYALEKGYSCENYSFFEYARYFDLPLTSKIIRWLFFVPFQRYGNRRSALRVKLFRFLYKNIVARPMLVLWGDRVMYSRSGAESIYYLPPTQPATTELLRQEQLKKTIYFSQVSGGVFRNPAGIEKHRNSLVEIFKPARWVDEKISAVFQPLRARKKTIVGVHIRQGDYAIFKGGKFVVSQKRIREILDEYLAFSQKGVNDVVFVIVSDGIIEPEVFKGLETVVCRGSAGEDLFTLAACDVVIGSDSTFGHFAAYYGNIPHIVMKKDPMDWEYYKGRNSYFTSKYFTVMLV
jgi:hypothetical protein